jgi:hypothetical protein
VKGTFKIFGICEAFILVLLGAAILWFSFSANYGLLMNEKFRWLTITGAASLLLMGLISLAVSRKRSVMNSLLFGVMLLIVFLGKPYTPGANSMQMPDSSLQAGLWDQIDQTRFPRKDLKIVSTESDEIYGNNMSFTTVGVAKRLEALDAHGSFALMTTVMYCCVADAFAVGLRVPSKDWRIIDDGQWIMVSGKLVKEQKEIAVPNFRLGNAMLSTVDKTYHLAPEKIMSYDRIDQLPLLTARFGTQTRLFKKALQESGHWQDLEQEGPFTVFVPVDQAIEDLSGLSFHDLSEYELKQFIFAHIVKGKFFTQDLMELDRLESLNGQALFVSFENATFKINQSRLLFKNEEARNGVIHFIYPAILPDGWERNTDTIKIVADLRRPPVRNRR